MFYFCWAASELVLNLSIPNLLSAHKQTSDKKGAEELVCVKSDMCMCMHIYTCTISLIFILLWMQESAFGIY